MMPRNKIVISMKKEPKKINARYSLAMCLIAYAHANQLTNQIELRNLYVSEARGFRTFYPLFYNEVSQP